MKIDMKITPQELRIGNYVFNEYSGLMIVSLIDETFFLSKKADGSSNDLYDKANPIPLTEEWLLKFDWNGYKQFCINSYFSIDTKGCLWYCGDFTGIVLEYIHQLQNLYFSLTGEELTIKE